MINHRRWVALLLCAIMTFSSVSVLADNTPVIDDPLFPQETAEVQADSPQNTDFLYYDEAQWETDAAVAAVEEEIDELSIQLNGKDLELEVAPVLQSGVTFVPLRSFCEAFDCTVVWNGSTTIVTRGTELKMTISNNSELVEANDRYFYMSHKPTNIGGSLMVPIRALAKVFSFETGWNEETKTVTLTGGAIMAWGKDFYDETDLLWLSRIIHAESQGESLEGKIAVGNVILNRTRASQFPDTIYDVIFDNKYGTQFTPTKTGKINNTPNAESVLAAKLCLEGHSVVTAALYFLNTSKATSNWIVKNRVFEVKIGCHSFYK